MVDQTDIKWYQSGGESALHEGRNVRFLKSGIAFYNGAKQFVESELDFDPQFVQIGYSTDTDQVFFKFHKGRTAAGLLNFQENDRGSVCRVTSQNLQNRLKELFDIDHDEKFTLQKNGDLFFVDMS